jgi:hypothetical protein
MKKEMISKMKYTFQTILLLLAGIEIEAFAPRSCLPQRSFSIQPKKGRLTIKNSKMIQEQLGNMLDTSQIVATATNPSVQAEIFGDLSHVCLDFLTFFSPDTIILRLLVLCGRTCSIAADISLDNTMTPDEALFQSTMAVIALVNFSETIIPLIRTRARQTASFRDRRIYHSVFRKAGFRYLDYLSLLSDAFQWVELSEGAIVMEDADNLLLTYHGAVFVHHSEVGSEHMYGIRNGKMYHDLIGNLTRSIHIIDAKLSSFSERANDDSENRNMMSHLTYLEAKTGGTMLLRLNMKRLTKIAEKDNRIRESIKTLLLIALQEKLSKTYK